MSRLPLAPLAVSPVAKPRMTRRDKWAQRPSVVRYRAYCDALRAELRAIPGAQLPEELEVVFVLPMPASWSKRKRAQHLGQPHRQRPDIDNLVKGLMDALLDEDAHVWSVNARKVWGADGAVRLALEVEHEHAAAA